MNEFQIHDAMGDLPEELLAPVEKLRQKKRYPIMKWAAIAACLCLLLGLPLGTGMMGAMKAESANAEAKVESPQENFLADMEDSIGAVTDGASVSSFRGKVLEVHEKYVLVEPLEGENERNCSDKIEVSFWNLKQVPEIAIGDILEIVYDGMIQETYPARITGTSAIRIQE